MKKRKKILLAGYLNYINAQNIKSPNNNFDLIFTIDENGRPTYSLSFQEEPVILNSGLGFILKIMLSG